MEFRRQAPSRFGEAKIGIGARLLIVSVAVLAVLLGVGLVAVSVLDERAYPFNGPRGPTPRELRAERALAHVHYRDVAPDDDCDDCKGQEAGFAFARKRKIANPDRCPAGEEDFQDGCRAYGERVEAAQAREGD